MRRFCDQLAHDRSFKRASVFSPDVKTIATFALFRIIFPYRIVYITYVVSASFF
jgi:hypothetical protein